MFKKSILACGKAIALLLAVYVPTFAIVSALLVPRGGPAPADAGAMTAALPLVIGISVAISLILIAIVGRSRYRSYGFRLVARRTLLSSVGLGLGIGFALRWLVWSLGIEEPSVFAGLTTWQVVAFFWVGAPIQEEIIFRGLVQTTLDKDLPMVVSVGRWRLSVAALCAAMAFSLVHLGLLAVGASLAAVVVVGASALLLGVVAGQFRWRTGSLIPGILIHAMFNVAGSV